MSPTINYTQNSLFPETFDNVLEKIIQVTRETSLSINNTHKKIFSQYFTEIAIAKQMATMLDVKSKATIGDHGAGTGILGASFIAAFSYIGSSFLITWCL